MNFFNFKKPVFTQPDLARWAEQGVVTKAQTNTKNTIEEIHQEFFTAGDKLLLESERILSECAAFDKTKALVLRDLGFISTNESQSVIQFEVNQQSANRIAALVNQYRVKYPNNKFITEEMIGKICLKYSLVFGDVSLFKGFVPKKNLEQITIFKTSNTFPTILKHNDLIIDISNWEFIDDNQYCFYRDEKGRHTIQQSKSNFDGVNFYGSVFIDDVSWFSTKSKIMGLQICAPIKDMNTKGMELKGYQLEKHIPDPVVLQPVEGGYLIVTAWGDEASDPLVVNQQNN